jgi:hypothetical protein
MRRTLALIIGAALAIGACGQAADDDPVIAAMDELIAAWNAGDGDAVRAAFDADFVFNTPSGVDISRDEWADRIVEQGGTSTLARVDDGVQNDDGTITIGVEASHPDSRYPAAYTWQVTLQGDRIVSINERRGTS